MAVDLSDPILWILVAVVGFFFFLYLLLRRTVASYREGVEKGRER